MRIPFFLAAQGLTSHDVAYDADAPQPCVRAGTPIPARFDHERGDLSPALARDGVPESTAGLVLLVDDPDAPGPGKLRALGAV
jgi:phosphatidylethanolamine-binding protein (PEBP) family uncharacterized protein